MIRAAFDAVETRYRLRWEKWQRVQVAAWTLFAVFDLLAFHFSRAALDFFALGFLVQIGDLQWRLDERDGDQP